MKTPELGAGATYILRRGVSRYKYKSAVALGALYS